MRIYRTKCGPFTEKPYYAPGEIERLCNEELENVGLLPATPEPIRVERFIEKRFKIYPTYEDLQEGVLGYIEFGPAGVKGITISRSLAEEGNEVAERRINTTLAHETGHALLHTHLFAFGHRPEPLFGKDIDPNNPKILCRNDTVQGTQGYKDTSYRWWEYQANLVIGPLLLPLSLVIMAMEPFLLKEGLIGSQMFDRSRCEEAIKILTETFDVNPIVARIRIDGLFPPEKDRQLTL